LRARLLDRTIYIENPVPDPCRGTFKNPLPDFLPLQVNVFDQKTDLIVGQYETQTRLTVIFHLRPTGIVELGSIVVFEGRLLISTQN
jgi:hypothetical protein